MSTLPRASTIVSRPKASTETEHERAAEADSISQPMAPPTSLRASTETLPRAGTFRRGSSAASNFSTAAPGTAAVRSPSLDVSAPASTLPVRRGAVPRAGTFKATTGGPPSAAIKPGPLSSPGNAKTVKQSTPETESQSVASSSGSSSKMTSPSADSTLSPESLAPNAASNNLADGPSRPTSSGDVSSVADSSSQSIRSRNARSSLPRGHTFRAPRTNNMAAAAANMPWHSGEPTRVTPGGRRPLPRAGTFAIGGGLPSLSPAEQEMKKAHEAEAEASKNFSAASDTDIFKRAPSDLQIDTKAICGMCGNCGTKGMPPWAPERLSKLSSSDREIVLRKLQAKEELGRLDRELREKQMRDKKARDENEAVQVRARAEAEAAELAKAGLDRKPSDCDDDVDDFEIKVTRLESALNSADITGFEDSEDEGDDEHIRKMRSNASQTIDMEHAEVEDDMFADSAGKHVEDIDDIADMTVSNGHKEHGALTQFDDRSHANSSAESKSLHPKVLRTGSVYLEEEVSQRRGRGRRAPSGSPSLVGSTGKLDPSENVKGMNTVLESELQESSVGPDDHMSASRPSFARLPVGSEKASATKLSPVGSADETNDPASNLDLRPSCDHDLADTESMSCSQCEMLEEKVRDLEEQLEVLRDVVALANKNSKNEGKDDGSAQKKASWKTKMMSAYYGGGGNSSSGERARLKEEVEALRKATDFLFEKLKEADSRSGNIGSRTHTR